MMRVAARGNAKLAREGDLGMVQRRIPDLRAVQSNQSHPQAEPTKSP